MKWRPIIIAGLAVAAVAGLIIWLQHAGLFGHWLQVHTGTVNEPGPYYGFWSGFGSDIAEFSINSRRVRVGDYSRNAEVRLGVNQPFLSRTTI